MILAAEARGFSGAGTLDYPVPAAGIHAWTTSIHDPHYECLLNEDCGRVKLPSPMIGKTGTQVPYILYLKVCQGSIC